MIVGQYKTSYLISIMNIYNQSSRQMWLVNRSSVDLVFRRFVREFACLQTDWTLCEAVALVGPSGLLDSFDLWKVKQK